MTLANAPSIPGADSDEGSFAPPPLPPWEPGPPVAVPADVLQAPDDRVVNFNFSPFLTAPAVIHKSLNNEYQGKVPVLTIPPTKIPSPLANYIAPDKIRDLKEYLCGPTPLPKAKPVPSRYGFPPPEGLLHVRKTENQYHNQDSDGKPSAPPTNGPEIWASWKRAYDIWNGFYIDGRINKAWIGSEYKRIQDYINEQERKANQGMDWVMNVDKKKPGVEKDKELPRWIRLLDENGRDSGKYVGNPEWEKKQAADALKKQSETLIGNGGGFFPMKSLKEFATFQEALAQGDHYAQAWTDGVQNSLWRPKRFGEDEKMPKIDIDADVGDCFREQIVGGKPDATGFNGWIDGGVDCGRSPFPLLRPKTAYACRPTPKSSHRYAKHISWDGVTGTVFNMPMAALHSPDANADHPEDMRLLTNATAYGDSYRDPRAESYGWAHNGTFPLDIRRVLRRKGNSDAKEGEAASTFDIVELDDEFALSKRRKIQQSDPWWVTEEQRLKRDVPTRLQPPSTLTYNREVLTEKEALEVKAILPVDDKAWEDEKTKDFKGEAQYFLTNLHGGTLIVNGLEVRKGFVAGPLPKFAVIENAHGQVSFWWGVEGRDTGASEGIADQDQAQWEHLRGLPGWEHVGMNAGDVWRQKIGDRREREKTGDDLEDDGFWKECKLLWQRGEVILNPEPKLTGIPPFWDGVFGNPALSFASPYDEFKHLVMRTEAQRRQKALAATSRGLSFPDSDSGWPGKLPVIKSAAEIAAEQAVGFWEDSKARLWTSQAHFAKRFSAFLDTRKQKQTEREEQINAELTAAAISKKRQAEFDLPDPKKVKLHSGLPPDVDIRLSEAALDYMQEEENWKAQIKLRLKGISPEDDARITQEYLAEREKHDLAAHHQHIEANEKRRAWGKPEIPVPPRWRFRDTEIKKHIDYMAAWKRAQHLAAGPVAAQTPEERRAIIQQQIESNKAITEQVKKAKAKREIDEAIAKRKRDYEEKQRLGLEEEARKKKAAEEKKKADIEAAIFYGVSSGTDWDGSLEGLAQSEGLELSWNGLFQIGNNTRPIILPGGKSSGGSTIGSGLRPGPGQSGNTLAGATTGGASGQAPSTAFNPPFGGGLTEEDDPSIQWAIAESLRKEFAAQNAAAKVQADLEKSRASNGLFHQREEILKNRARSAGLTPLEFAQREGHSTVVNYLKFETDKAMVSKTAAGMLPGDHFLAVNRLQYKNALESALKSNRDLNGIDIQDALRAQNWNGSLAEYLEQAATKQVTMADCPNVPIPAFEPPLPRNATEAQRQAYNVRGMRIRAQQQEARRTNDSRWRGLQDRIRNVAQFELRIAALEQGKATTQVVSDTYGGKVMKGLIF